MVFWVHLSLGVAVGAVVMLLSLTGVLLAFERQVTRWADRAQVQAGTGRLGPEALVAAAERHSPRGTVSRVTVRADARAAADVALGRDTVAVDPASGKPLGGSSVAARRFFREVTGLHRWLALPAGSRPTGRAVTGAATLAFLGLLVTGPFIWWPRGGGAAAWTRALRPVRGLRGRARSFNWHNVAGVWALVPLMVIAASGLVISYAWANDLVFRLAGEAPPARRPPAREPGGASVPSESRGLDALLHVVQAEVPGWRSITLTLPRAGASTVAVSVDTSEGGRPDTRTQLTLDRRSGQLVTRESFVSASSGRRARSWLRWLHTGEALGLPGQALAAGASGAAVVLGWTGLGLALRRWRARRAAGVRRPSSPASVCEAVIKREGSHEDQSETARP